MPFGNRCGPGALRYFELAAIQLEVMMAESRGERMNFHIPAIDGGCLEVRLTKIADEHVYVCEVPLRTLGPKEEALCIINNFLNRLHPDTRNALVKMLTKEKTQC